MRLVLVANSFLPSFLTLGAVPAPTGEACLALLRIELDDELFLHGRVDVRALRQLQDLAGEVVVVGLEPGGDRGREVGGVADDLLDRASGPQRDDVVRPHVVARDVHAATVHLEMAVADDLPRLRARGGEAEPVDDVVEARLEHAQQLLAGDPRPLGRLLVVVAELLLEDAVIAARLLLLAELEQVLRLLDPAAPVLARRIAAPLDGALLRQAALALEEELHALAAAELALRPETSRHYTRLRFFGRTPLWACGETSLTPRISRPAAWRERMAVSRPEPGPLTNTSTFWSPCSMPLRAAESAVTWAANGVDLREPLKPAEPALSQTMTFPSLSVSVTIVLLKDVLMCAWPMAMFFLTRRRVRPRAACLRGGAIYRITSSAAPSCRGRRSSSGLCACARSSSSAGRSPGGRAGAAPRGRRRSPVGA